jgi:hypothetical protein
MPISRAVLMLAGVTLAALILSSPQRDVAAIAADAAAATIHPGGVWLDNRGEQIQAHGGGILKIGDTYYWFGEDRGRAFDAAHRAVSCYASTDLVHWTFRKDVFTMSVDERPADLPGTGLVVERPKVFYNAKARQFVMYMHLDSGNYAAAEVGVAVSDTVDGTYTFLKHFRPLGQQSRDIGQFIDDDGTPYLVFEDRPNGFHIAKLSDDYLSVAQDVSLIRMHMEGGALVHYQGLYYAIGSHLTGWNPNPNLYATATSLAGPWSEFRDIAPPETNTYGSQSTMLLKVAGTKATTVIFMGDIWRPATQWDSRYLWMPLEIGSGRLWLPQPRDWSLDVETGDAAIDTAAPPMVLPPPAPRRPRPSDGPRAGAASGPS